MSDEAVKYPVTREQLYAECWERPMLRLAEKYGVSSSYLARVCARMNVPRPPTGYWAKLAHGKKVSKPPLPEATAADELEWTKGAENYWQKIRQPKVKPTAPKSKPRRKQHSADLPKTHRLIMGAKAHFLKSRDTNDGFLRPYKNILMDMIVSEASLDRGLQIANALYKAFESYAYRVDIAPSNGQFHGVQYDERENPKKPRDDRDNYYRRWGPQRPTVAYIGNLVFGLKIYETSHEIETVSKEWNKPVPVSHYSAIELKKILNGWKRIEKTFWPSGRFVILAYSPYYDVEWQMIWKINEKADFEKICESIPRKLYTSSDELLRLIGEADERARIRKLKREEDERRWAAEEKARHEAKSLEISQAQLAKVIEQWGKAQTIEAFFHQVEAAAAAKPEEEKAAILERLHLCRELMDYPDPLQSLLDWKSPAEIFEIKSRDRYWY